MYPFKVICLAGHNIHVLQILLIQTLSPVLILIVICGNDIEDI